MAAPYVPFGQRRNQQSFNIESEVFSVNCNGRAAVTADSQGLCVLGLFEAPFPVHRILHQSRWGVTALECCRHNAHPERVASASNNNVLIWDIAAETAPLIQVIRHHTKPVGAVAWSHGNGNILSSTEKSSVPRVSVWDLRASGTGASNRPCLEFVGRPVTDSNGAFSSFGAQHHSFRTVWNVLKGALLFRSQSPRSNSVKGGSISPSSTVGTGVEVAMCWNPMYSQYLAVSSSAAVCLSSTDMNASSTVCKAEVMVWDLRKNASLSSPHSNDVDLSPTCVSHFRTSGSRVNCLRWHPANSHLLGTSCNVPGDNFQQGCVVEVWDSQTKSLPKSDSSLLSDSPIGATVIPTHCSLAAPGFGGDNHFMHETSDVLFIDKVVPDFLFTPRGDAVVTASFRTTKRTVTGALKFLSSQLDSEPHTLDVSPAVIAVTPIVINDINSNGLDGNGHVKASVELFSRETRRPFEVPMLDDVLGNSDEEARRGGGGGFEGKTSSPPPSMRTIRAPKLELVGMQPRLFRSMGHPASSVTVNLSPNAKMVARESIRHHNRSAIKFEWFTGRDDPTNQTNIQLAVWENPCRNSRSVGAQKMRSQLSVWETSSHMWPRSPQPNDQETETTIAPWSSRSNIRRKNSSLELATKTALANVRSLGYGRFSKSICRESTDVIQAAEKSTAMNIDPTLLKTHLIESVAPPETQEDALGLEEDEEILLNRKHSETEETTEHKPVASKDAPTSADHKVPSPAFCAAFFCASGALVCFNNEREWQKVARELPSGISTRDGIAEHNNNAGATHARGGSRTSSSDRDADDSTRFVTRSKIAEGITRFPQTFAEYREQRQNAKERRRRAQTEQSQCRKQRRGQQALRRSSPRLRSQSADTSSRHQQVVRPSTGRDRVTSYDNKTEERHDHGETPWEVATRSPVNSGKRESPAADHDDANSAHSGSSVDSDISVNHDPNLALVRRFSAPVPLSDPRGEGENVDDFGFADEDFPADNDRDNADLSPASSTKNVKDSGSDSESDVFNNIASRTAEPSTAKRSLITTENTVSNSHSVRYPGTGVSLMQSLTTKPDPDADVTLMFEHDTCVSDVDGDEWEVLADDDDVFIGTTTLADIEAQLDAQDSNSQFNDDVGREEVAALDFNPQAVRDWEQERRTVSETKSRIGQATENSISKMAAATPLPPPGQEFVRPSTTVIQHMRPASHPHSNQRSNKIEEPVGGRHTDTVRHARHAGAAVDGSTLPLATRTSGTSVSVTRQGRPHRARNQSRTTSNRKLKRLAKRRQDSGKDTMAQSLSAAAVAATRKRGVVSVIGGPVANFSTGYQNLVYDMIPTTFNVDTTGVTYICKHNAAIAQQLVRRAVDLRTKRDRANSLSKHPNDTRRERHSNPLPDDADSPRVNATQMDSGQQIESAQWTETHARIVVSLWHLILRTVLLNVHCHKRVGGGFAQHGEYTELRRREGQRSSRPVVFPFARAALAPICKYLEGRGDVQTLGTLGCLLGLRNGPFTRHRHTFADMLYLAGAIDLHHEVVKGLASSHSVADDVVAFAFRDDIPSRPQQDVDTQVAAPSLPGAQGASGSTSSPAIISAVDSAGTSAVANANGNSDLSTPRRSAVHHLGDSKPTAPQLGDLAESFQHRCDKGRLYAGDLRNSAVAGLFGPRNIIGFAGYSRWAIDVSHVVGFTPNCVICLLPSRHGMVTTCATCGHGGHFHCMQEWFQDESTCPSGCGCECVPRDEGHRNGSGHRTGSHKPDASGEGGNGDLDANGRDKSKVPASVRRMQQKLLALSTDFEQTVGLTTNTGAGVSVGLDENAFDPLVLASNSDLMDAVEALANIEAAVNHSGQMYGNGGFGAIPQTPVVRPRTLSGSTHRNYHPSPGTAPRSSHFGTRETSFDELRDDSFSLGASAEAAQTAASHVRAEIDDDVW